MLQEIYLKDISTIEDTKIKELEKMLNKSQRSKSYLYASVIQRKLRLSADETINILNKLVQKNILKRCFYIQIDDETAPQIVKRFFDIPEEIYSEKQSVEVQVSLEKHVLVCYEVVNNE